MKSIAIAALAISISAGAQTINPTQVRGTAVVQSPTGSQTINQPLIVPDTYTSQFTGVYTSGGGVNQLQIRGDGIDPSVEFNTTNGSFAEVSAVYGGLIVPSGATGLGANAIMGQVVNNASFATSGVSPVAVFGSGRCTVGSCSVWGGNFIAIDAPGTTNDLIWGTEIDVNVQNPTTHGYGLDIIGRWSAQPGSTVAGITMPAIMVHKPVDFGTDTTSYGWTSGLQFEAGAITGVGAAVSLAPLANAVSQRSQLIQFTANNSVGSGQIYSQYEDPLGNINFIPAGGGPVSGGGSGIYDAFNNDGSIGVNSNSGANAILGHFLQPNVGTSHVSEITLGASETTNNSALIQFSNVGGTGSISNQAAFGVFGGAPITVDGGGNLNIPGQQKNVALKSLTGTRFMCVDSSGILSSSPTACSGT